MLSYLDPILFPDECKVYEVEPGRYVYPIFKNGSSSLIRSAKLVNYFDLKNIQTVEVFLRNPFERYVSGVQTYLRNLDSTYDRDTVLKFIGEFLFLNRHFALQFHWVVNFARYSQAWMYFRPIEELHTATEYTLNVLSRDQTLIDYFKDNQKLHFYLQLDKILYENFIGKTISFSQILNFIKSEHSNSSHRSHSKSKVSK
jgi:hypothetical protein